MGRLAARETGVAFNLGNVRREPLSARKTLFDPLSSR